MCGSFSNENDWPVHLLFCHQCIIVCVCVCVCVEGGQQSSVCIKVRGAYKLSLRYSLNPEMGDGYTTMTWTCIHVEYIPEMQVQVIGEDPSSVMGIHVLIRYSCYKYMNTYS